jgi:cytochrome c oxidase cbb3-type subunit 3
MMRMLRSPIVLWVVILGLSSPLAHAAHDGARLYAQHCAACHGSAGTGGVGVPLAQPDLLATVDDRYLIGTIRHGRPGRVMPAFRQLSDAEVKAIVAHIRSWSAKPAPTPATGHIKGDKTRGAKLYAERCAACHGDQGQGGHGTGVTFSRPRDLAILAPALNNPGFLTAASDAVIKATLVRGREGTPMSSFLKQGLHERDIDDIVTFVRGFEHAPAASATVIVTESPIIVRDSNYSLQQTVENVKQAFSAANMRIVRTGPLEAGLVEQGSENPKQYIVDACDFKFLNRALAVDPRVGLFLPCRIVVSEHGGKVQVMSINPKRLSAIFNNSELNEMCEQMFKIYSGLLDDATL